MCRQRPITSVHNTEHAGHDGSVMGCNGEIVVCVQYTCYGVTIERVVRMKNFAPMRLKHLCLCKRTWGQNSACHCADSLAMD